MASQNPNQPLPPPPLPPPPKPTVTSRTPSVRQVSHFVHKLPVANIVGLAFFLLVIVAALFYLLNGQPLIPITPQSSVAFSQSSGLAPTPPLPDPAFVILGESNGEVFTFYKGIKKIYAFNPTVHSERPVCDLFEFDDFVWHSSGKLLVLSHANNTLGSIYILDLTQKNPVPFLVTDRESALHFPRNLKVASPLPMSWSDSGDAITFVAQDIQNNTESLFVFDLTSKQLIYTPARNLARISSVVWLNADKQLALVAVSDGQETRYIMDRVGSGFTTWNTK